MTLDIASTSSFKGTTASAVVTLPTGIKAGDLLLAFFAGAASLSPTLDVWSATGWTSLQSDGATTPVGGSEMAQALFSRTATGSEGSTVTFANSAGADDTIICVVRITGNVPTVDTSSKGSTSGSPSHVTASFTPTRANCMVLSGFGIDQSAGSGTGQWTPVAAGDGNAETEDFDDAEATNSTVLGVFHERQSGAAVATTIGATYTGAGLSTRNGLYTIVSVYEALTSPATPIFVCGAECGLAAVGTLGVGTEHWSSVAGGSLATVATSGPSPMRSTRAFRFNFAASGGGLIHTFTAAIASGGTAVGRFYIYFTTLPNAAVPLLTFHGGTGGTERGAYFDSATNTIQAASSVASLGGGGVAVTTGVWYRVDVKSVFAATHTVDVQVDGAATTQHSAAIAAETCTSVGVGMIAQTATTDFYIDDVIASGTSTDYPIGAGTVVGLYPNGDGTHLYSATTDFSKAGTALTACAFPVAGETTSWQSLTKPLSTAIDNTKFVTDAGGASTEYLEWTFDDLPSAAQVNGLMVVSTNHAATATADNVTLRLVDGGTTNDIFTTADFSEITIVTAVKTYSTAPSTSAAWTKTLVDALKMRWGLSTDISPTPRLDGLVFEVDYTPAPAAEALGLIFQAVQRAATR